MGGGYVILQKNYKKHKNSTHSKIKFYIIFINFFLMMDIKFFLKEGDMGS